MLAKTIMNVLRPLFRNHVYTVRHGLAKGLKRKGGFGFVPSPLTQEEKFLIDLDLTGQTIYDMGGFHGIFTLFFARSVGKNGRVVTFEPNPKNYVKILDNIRVNHFKNAQVEPIAVGNEKGKKPLVYQRSALGAGSLQEEIKAQFVQKRGVKTVQVEIDTLDNLIEQKSLPEPDFVKIDVEGLEMDVLLGMNETVERHKPKIFVELHGVNKQKKSENTARVTKYLIEKGYTIYHVESELSIISRGPHTPNEGHLYCT